MTKLLIEIGQNHLGSKETLNSIVNELIEIHNTIGSFVVKFQYWNVDNIYNKIDLRYPAAKARELQFINIIDQILKLRSYNIESCISLFGAESWHKTLAFSLCDYIKYASSEYDMYVKDLIDFPLLNNKRIILSDGYNSEIKAFKCNEFILACIAQYPSLSSDTMNKIDFKKHNGLSCHSTDLDAIKFAIDHNMLFAEKHYCLATQKGTSDFRDLQCSITKKELVLLLDYIKHSDSDFIHKTMNNKRTVKL